MSTSSSKLLVLLSLGALAACGKAKSSDDTGTSDPPDVDTYTDDSGEDACGGTAPVVDAIDCENAGLQDHFETGEPTPTIKISVDVSDEDADLHIYTMKLFYDDTVDGSMDTSEDPFGSTPQTLTSDECTAAEASLGMTVYISEGSMENGAEYEWGVIIADANGIESDLVTTSCYIPNTDGSDGTGSDDDKSSDTGA